MHRRVQTRIGVVAGVLALLAVSGSVAYFVATGTAQNIISTGGVGIQLYELADPEGDGNTTPFLGLVNVMPGMTYSKILYVENTDTGEVWVRMKVSLAAELETGAEVIVPNYNEYILLGGIGGNWSLGTDGYYYYGSMLSSGEATEPLFSNVTFSAMLPNEYQGAKFKLMVAAEATQAKNNGSSAKNASFGGE